MNPKFLLKKLGRTGRAQWLKPVIAALWEAEAGGSQGQEIKTILANTVILALSLLLLKLSICLTLIALISNVHSSSFICLRLDLVLSPRLECSGHDLTHCNLCLLSSMARTTGKNHISGLIFVFFVKTGSPYFAQAGRQLRASRESTNAVPHYHKLCSRVSHIWGNRRGQHIRSAMDKPRPGKTTYVIMVSPLPVETGFHHVGQAGLERPQVIHLSQSPKVLGLHA
ncbi:NANOG neighbor homeobox [Plecturocebus cupreus]